METPLFIILGCMAMLNAQKEPCWSGQYTAKGECCISCQVGEGVIKRCGVNQTVCEPCLDSVTYSDTISHTEACKPCTECFGHKRMEAPCVESDDAVCACAYGYFTDNKSGQCKLCKSCPEGFGMMMSCTNIQDTICEKCPEGTYSDEDNDRDPCLPCTICEDGEIESKECTFTSDTVCYDPNPRVSSVTPTSSDFPYTGTSIPPFDLSSSSATTSGDSKVLPPTGVAENLIPVYCSILAAVIAGLVAFIVFKRWNSCKQNKEGGNSHPVNQTPSPEGEKLHSDSGISVNSDSTAEQPTGHHQGKNDMHLHNKLSSHKQEEVEKLLSGSLEQTWKSLAGELGYQDEIIDSFTREEFPVRAMLSDWSSKDSATTDALYTALRKIQRDDIAQSLNSDSTATSPV